MNKKHDSVKYFMSLSQEALSWEITPQNKKSFQIVKNVCDNKIWEFRKIIE